MAGVVSAADVPVPGSNGAVTVVVSEIGSWSGVGVGVVFGK